MLEGTARLVRVLGGGGRPGGDAAWGRKRDQPSLERLRHTLAMPQRACLMRAAQTAGELLAARPTRDRDGVAEASYFLDQLAIDIHASHV